MKNSTLLSTMALLSLLSAPSVAKAEGEVNTQIWTGWQVSDQAEPTNVWSTAVANWTNLKDFLDDFASPVSFLDGSNVIFDDRSDLRDGVDVHKAVLNDIVNVNSLLLSGSFNYNITGTGSINGTGDLIKEGESCDTLAITNNMTGVTYIKGGKLLQKLKSVAFTDSIVFQGGAINLGTNIAATDAYDFTTPCYIPEGETAYVETGRYSNILAPFYGKGSLHIVAGGERTYWGKKSTGPNVTSEIPEIYIDKYAVDGYTPGFWGLVLVGDGTCDVATEDKVAEYLKNTKVHLSAGTTLVTESKQGIRIGELTAEDEDCRIYPYYKNGGTTGSFFVGGLNTDVVLPARLCNAESNGVPQIKDKINFVKEGTGTYTLTHPNSLISGMVYVRGGKLFISPREAEVTGFQAKDGCAITVEDGILGGNGRISSAADIYGTIAPGEDGIGTMTFDGVYYASNDSVGAQKSYIIMRPGSKMEFEISTVESYDKIVCTDSIAFKTEEDEDKPLIKVSTANFADIKAGDEFTLISATKKSEISDFTIDMPEIFEMREDIVAEIPAVEATETTEAVEGVAGSYKLVLVAKSDYTGISNVSAESDVTVYPVPAQNQITVSGNVDKVVIFDNSGRMVKSADSNIVNIADLNAGIYVAKIYTENAVVVRRIIKK